MEEILFLKQLELSVGEMKVYLQLCHSGDKTMDQRLAVLQIDEMISRNFTLIQETAIAPGIAPKGGYGGFLVRFNIQIRYIRSCNMSI